MDQMHRAINSGLHGNKQLMQGDVSKYYTDEWDEESGRFKLKDGYSHVASQDAPNPLASMADRSNKKGGGFEYGDSVNIYKKVEQKQSPAQQAPAPEAKPEPDKKPAGPIELSPEIQQAKERVNKYQDSIDGSAGSLFDSDNVDYNSLNEADDTNETAAASFLDSKKASLKEKMVFNPDNSDFSAV